MAWIESHSTLRTHKKLKPLCDALNISRVEAIGTLHCLWWWAVDNRETGDLAGLFDRDIAAACDWSGDPKKLIKALKNTGWITQDDQLKDWLDYAGRLVTDRLRKRAERILSKTCPRTVLDETPSTVQDRTVPDSKLGLFNKTQETAIKTAISNRLNYTKDSEACHIEYERITKTIGSDKRIKDPMAVAMHRAIMG